VAHVVNVSDEEVEEVDHPNVGDDDLIDDIDNYSSENDVDDDVDRNEPFTNIEINRSFLSCFPWVHVTLLRIFGHDETHQLQLQG
jgi:hypothetical protein